MRLVVFQAFCDVLDGVIRVLKDHTHIENSAVGLWKRIAKS
jgi:hypothetical protein